MTCSLVSWPWLELRAFVGFFLVTCRLVSWPWLELRVFVGFWFVERKKKQYIKKDEKREVKRIH